MSLIFNSLKRIKSAEGNFQFLASFVNVKLNQPRKMGVDGTKRSKIKLLPKLNLVRLLAFMLV